MKRSLLLVPLLLLFCSAVHAQPGPQPINAKRIYSGTAVPTMPCSPGPSYTDVYIRTTTGVHYTCTAAPNTWTADSSGGGGGGITNSAGNNIVPKSDGTNIVASSIGDNGTTVTVNTNKFTVTEANGNTFLAGILSAGSGPTTLTDSAGKILSAALNTVAVANGGTGIASGTSGGVPYFSGSTTIASSAALPANKLVKGGGAGAAPAASLAGDDGTTFTYTGAGGISLAPGTGVAGTFTATEGTAPSLTANAFSIYAPADVAAGGLAYILPAAAATGIMRATNSSGVMTITHDAGVSNLAASTSADLRGVLSDENGTGASLFSGATSPDFTTSVTTSSTSFTAWAGATTLLTLGGTGASASIFAPSTLDATTSTTGAIRTSGGISAAKALNVGTTITGGGAFSIGTSNAATVGTIELGAASDTTLSRVSAGVIAVEGVNVLASGATGVQTFLTTPSSANLAAALTDETGTGVAVFGTSPAITTSITTPSTTFALVNTTATTVNFAGAATTINMGSGANVTMNPADQSGTNTAGNTFNLVGGLGTSQGAPGRVHLQGGALITASGTTVQTAVDRYIAGASKVLANNTTTTVANVTAASNTVAAIELHYAVSVFNATDLQVEEGIISCHLTNKAAALANNTCVKSSNQQAATSGTLTVTWTITAANPGLLQINANSSLTPSTGYPQLNYNLHNLTNQAVAIQ